MKARKLSLTYIRKKLKIKVVYAKEPMPDVSKLPHFVRQYDEAVKALEKSGLPPGW